jgi:hypothetical protein
VVCTYIADASFIDDSLQPYSWYKDFVLAGAEEHGLPAEYVESRIVAVHAIGDPDLAVPDLLASHQVPSGQIDTGLWSVCRARFQTSTPVRGDAEWPVGRRMLEPAR